MSTTLNMNLVLPDVNSTEGPEWATELNNALGVIDSHTHSPGSGVPITTSGLNITDDLTFNSNNAIDLNSVRLNSLGSALTGGLDLGCLYNLNGDLYYNNSNGDQVPITNGAGIAGSPGSISGMSGNVSVSYSGSTFVFLSDSLTSANIDAGSVILRQVAASANGITLKSPNSLAADYSVTFPAALPGAGISPAFMQISSSGAITAAYKVDNSSLELDSGTGTLRVKAQGIVNSMYYDRSITGGKIALGTITGTVVASGGIGQTNMAANSVGTSQLIDGNVTSLKIQSGVNLAGFPTSAAKYLIASQTNAASGLGLIRGSVDSSGTAVLGEGFSVSDVATYTKRVTFTTAFASAPVIVFSNYDGIVTGLQNAVVSSTTTYFDLTDATSAFRPASFSFIAIGPRA